VDVIEIVVRISPLSLAVIDLKLEIRRYPRRLNRRQVGPQYNGGGMLIGEVHCPDPRTSADVQDVGYIRRNRRKVKFALKRQGVEMMCEIQMILGLLVIGPPGSSQLARAKPSVPTHQYLSCSKA
jgi:hypothetical protein